MASNFSDQDTEVWQPRPEPTDDFVDESAFVVPSRPILFIPIDGIVADTHTHLLETLSRIHGVSVNLDRYDGEVSSIYELIPDVRLSEIKRLLDSPDFAMGIPPNLTAINSLHAVNADIIYFRAHPNPDSIHLTRQWLDRHACPPGEVRIIPEMVMLAEEAKTILAERRINRYSRHYALILTDPEYALDALVDGLNVLLFSTRYNRRARVHEKIRRIEAIEDAFRKEEQNA